MSFVKFGQAKMSALMIQMFNKSAGKHVDCATAWAMIQVTTLYRIACSGNWLTDLSSRWFAPPNVLYWCGSLFEHANKYLSLSVHTDLSQYISCFIFRM